jgi:hypothetical protein
MPVVPGASAFFYSLAALPVAAGCPWPEQWLNGSAGGVPAGPCPAPLHPQPAAGRSELVANHVPGFYGDSATSPVDEGYFIRSYPWDSITTVVPYVGPGGGFCGCIDVPPAPKQCWYCPLPDYGISPWTAELIRTAHRHGARVLGHVGHGSASWPELASRQWQRDTARNLTRWFVGHGFDGIQLGESSSALTSKSSSLEPSSDPVFDSVPDSRLISDIESLHNTSCGPPPAGGSCAAVTDFVCELRETLDAALPGSHLTLFAGVSPFVMDPIPFQNFTKLKGCVDYFLAGAYDMVGTSNNGYPAGTGPGTPGFWQPAFPGEFATNSPLPDVQTGLAEWQHGSPGVAGHQLVLALPWYGFLAPCDTLALGSPCRPGLGDNKWLGNNSLPACGGERVGFGFITDVVASRAGAVRGWNNRTSTPFVDMMGSADGKHQFNRSASSAAVNSTRFRAVYDDARSISLKAKVAKAAGLRGMGMWTSSSLNYNEVELAAEMWAALASGLPTHTPSFERGVRPVAAPHKSDGCQLNGEFVSGACRCDKGWEGPDCGQLAIDPQRPSTVIWPVALPNDATRTSAWGGTIAKDESGTYHLWDNSVCEDAACMHYNAQFVHATASTLDGPFRAESIAFPGAECPHVTAADGYYYMLGVDHLKINATTNCTGGKLTSQPLPRDTVVPSSTKPPATYQEAETGTSAWFIARASQPSGPWTMSYPALVRSNSLVETVDASAESGLLLGNNACALSLRNGSIIVAYRYNTAQAGLNWRVAVAVGTSWKGPFTIIKAPVIDLPNEDPFIWQNRRGYHILTHHFNESCNLKTYTAQHLYSTDLLSWSAGPLAPYSTTVDFGTKPPLGFADTVVTFDRRERPALVLDPSGNPDFLVSGVEKERSGEPGHGNTSCVSLTLGTPLKFDDANTNTIELFRFRGGGADTPCVRIPSLVAVPGTAVVLALAECRQFVGDGCRPWADDNSSLQGPGWGANRYICGRRSTDYGRSFGPWQRNITRMRSWNPASVTVGGSILLFYDDADPWLSGRPSAGGTPWLVRSSDLGISWSAPAPLDIVGPRPPGAAGGFNLGPGRALVLISGRILVAGGSSVALGKCPQRPDGGQCKRLTSFVIYSDDHARTFRVSAATIPDLEEPQLAEYLLPSPHEDGRGGARSVVVLNGRQNNSFPLGEPCDCRGQVYSDDGGLSWSSTPTSDAGGVLQGGSDVLVDWLPGLPSPSVQSSIFRAPNSGRISHGRWSH